MIISASRRTDIPAFYSEWLFNRITEGYCLTVNPNNAKQVRRIDLSLNNVEAFVFWTKNPRPMFPRLPIFDKRGYSYIFLYTLNNYPEYLEPCVPNLENRLSSFKALSDKIGPERIIWRYDPIILTDSITTEFHEYNFHNLCSTLKGFTKRVIISFLDMYPIISKRMNNNLPVGEKFIDFVDNIETVYTLSKTMSQIATSYDMEIFSCAELFELKNAGIIPGACIDGLYLTSIFNRPFSTKKDKGQRPECNCVMSTDIGQYDTCRHRCLYCYALKNVITLEKNIQNFDVNAPTITGWPKYEPPAQRELL